MGIQRADININGTYTRVPSEWTKDPRHTMASLGVLTHITSHRPGWTIYLDTLAQQLNAGKYALQTAIDHLVKLGYLERIRVRGAAGKFGGSGYVLTDPHREHGFSILGEPATNQTKNPTNYKNQKKKNEEEKTAAAPHARAASTAPPAPSSDVSSSPQRKLLELAQTVVDATKARSVHGVAAIIGWAEREHELSPEDAAQHLIALGSNKQPVSIAALAKRLEAPLPVAPEEKPVDEEREMAAARRAGRLRLLADEHPQLAVGFAILLEMSEHRAVKCTTAEADRVQQELRGIARHEPTPEDVHAGARAARAAGAQVSPHTIERHLRTLSRA